MPASGTIKELEHVLHTDGGRDLMELMRRLVLGRAPPPEGPPHSLESAARIGLLRLTSGGPRLTEAGWTIGHALREYLQWEERGRRMQRSDWVPALSEEFYRGRDLLEVGSGFGCNLLTLQRLARSALGVEIEPLYVPLGAALARVAGLPPPRIVVGRGEAIPCPAASVDVVLAYSSIQYMHIERALAEMRRVLRPGGQVVIFTYTFAGYLRNCVRRAIAQRRPRAIARDAANAIGAAAYPVVGRLLLREADPVHLPFSMMRGRLARAGLTLSDSASGVNDDVAVYVAHAG